MFLSIVTSAGEASSDAFLTALAAIIFSKAVLEGPAPSACLDQKDTGLCDRWVWVLCQWMLPSHLEEMPVTFLGLLWAILQPERHLSPSPFGLGVKHGAGGLDVAPNVVVDAPHVQLCSVSLSRNESLGGFFKKLSLPFFPV